MKATYIILFLSLVTISLHVSCKKKDKKPEDTSTPNNPADPNNPSNCDTIFIDNFYDTIFPSEYLMTYPGSQWSYDNGQTVTCDQWENVTIATPTSGNCVTVNRSHYILPHTSMNYPYIFYNKAISTYLPNKTKSYQLLDTVNGVFFTQSQMTGTMPDVCIVTDTFEVVELLESMQVLSTTYQNVIHVRQKSHQYCPHATAPIPDYFTHSYYAKNVGLIKQQWIHMYDPDEEKNLVNYTIGPH